MNSRNGLFALSVGCLGALWPIAVFAQTPSPGPVFDVASIKPAPPDARGTSLLFQPPNGLKMKNAPVRMLIAFAYDVRDFQISGGPGWVSTERFDILANAGESPGAEKAADDIRQATDSQRTAKQDEMRARVRALLADRFELKTHVETREGSIYALVVAKNRAKLRDAVTRPDGRGGMQGGRGRLRGMGATVGMLVNFLSTQLGRPVSDQTALTGKYDFELEWTPDATQAGPLRDGLPPDLDNTPPNDSSGPTLFTAVQEQLGLRLVSQKGQVETLVIDSVEKPSEN